jgi:endonuclease/exonuclease/phosphatase family metal-dependent hydrolase
MLRFPICAAFALPVLAAYVLSAAEDEPATALRVLSFNIRYNNTGDGENAWPKRRDWVGEILRDQKPNLIGTQEVLKLQYDDLRERLPGYEWHGAGRDDGKEKGEYVPVAWNKERFDLADKGLFWLSTIPDTPGSKSWDAAITRMVTWVKLKDKKSGKSLVFANTHFDHRGQQSREESAKLIVERLEKIAGDSPLLLTGDFNVTAQNEAYKTIAKMWSDTRTTSATKPEGPDSTWNGFQAIAPGQQIDFIFARGLKSQRHAILTMQKEGRFPSDHLPVVAEVAW